MPWTPIEAALNTIHEDGGLALQSIVFRCVSLLAKNRGAELIFVPPQGPSQDPRESIYVLESALKSMKILRV